MIFVYAVLAIAALLLLPFSHVVGLAIAAIGLFVVFHVPPLLVVGAYLAFHLLRWILPLLGLAGLVAWFSRGNGSDA
jgi:hypothetical protein